MTQFWRRFYEKTLRLACVGSEGTSSANLKGIGRGPQMERETLSMPSIFRCNVSERLGALDVPFFKVWTWIFLRIHGIWNPLYDEHEWNIFFLKVNLVDMIRHILNVYYIFIYHKLWVRMRLPVFFYSQFHLSREVNSLGIPIILDHSHMNFVEF